MNPDPSVEPPVLLPGMSSAQAIHEEDGEKDLERIAGQIASQAREIQHTPGQEDDQQKDWESSSVSISGKECVV